MAEKAFYTTLKNRGLVTVSGPDARKFLQDIVTNDINLLDAQPSVYACLLSPQGKFLHDFFITEKDGALLLECEGGIRAQDLSSRLSKYKLRANVKIECVENISVYSIPSSSGLTGGSIYPDPRNAELGFRAFEKPALPEQPFEIWDALRISLTIPDGSRDLVIDKSALDEGRIDKLNGVSYDKGCYVGQELTARMHHRGLGKKHLYIVSGELLREPGEEIRVNDALLGEMRSRCGDIGLALLKDEVAG
ncbi:MAG TPA: folate-binding protein [Alphaproteobacteria bacterium]|nr:folate-binding protein YgfZ [Micavibrio sp.]MBK9563591.1 folate-binding protein YgfZ [Micavibrio sp.]HQX27348.1 folate-binding protein [Alphaproteobacteria bacterium]